MNAGKSLAYAQVVRNQNNARPGPSAVQPRTEHRQQPTSFILSLVLHFGNLFRICPTGPTVNVYHPNVQLQFFKSMFVLNAAPTATPRGYIDLQSASTILGSLKPQRDRIIAELAHYLLAAPIVSTFACAENLDDVDVYDVVTLETIQAAVFRVFERKCPGMFSLRKTISANWEAIVDCRDDEPKIEDVKALIERVKEGKTNGKKEEASKDDSKKMAGDSDTKKVIIAALHHVYKSLDKMALINNTIANRHANILDDMIVTNTATKKAPTYPVVQKLLSIIERVVSRCPCRKCSAALVVVKTPSLWIDSYYSSNVRGERQVEQIRSLPTAFLVCDYLRNVATEGVPKTMSEYIPAEGFGLKRVDAEILAHRILSACDLTPDRSNVTFTRAGPYMSIGPNSSEVVGRVVNHLWHTADQMSQSGVTAVSINVGCAGKMEERVQVKFGRWSESLIVPNGAFSIPLTPGWIGSNRIDEPPSMFMSIRSRDAGVVSTRDVTDALRHTIQVFLTKKAITGVHPVVVGYVVHFTLAATTNVEGFDKLFDSITGKDLTMILNTLVCGTMHVLRARDQLPSSQVMVDVGFVTGLKMTVHAGQLLSGANKSAAGTIERLEALNISGVSEDELPVVTSDPKERMRDAMRR